MVDEKEVETEKTEIIADEDPNPIQKLIAGFCSPTKINPIPLPDEDEVVSRYAPDLAPQTPLKPGAEPDSPAAATQESTEAESAPESVVSKKVVANRQKRGIEVFIMALVFVLGTLLTLNKLGSTSDMGVKMVDKSTFEVPVVEEPIEVTPEAEVEEEL